MTLLTYLRQFKNICWYPSAYKDTLSISCLSQNSLKSYGIDSPDCFIFTDYDGRGDLFLDTDQKEISFNYEGTEHQATAYNIIELERLNIGFDIDMVGFSSDNNYGRVFAMDITINHPKIGKNHAKLVYIVIENTKFAFDYLIKKKLKIKYIINSRYGHGFGGGISNGLFICHILKDLHTEYFISDMNGHHNEDIADKYLTERQKEIIPILKIIDDFTYRFRWKGYDNTILYQVIDYKKYSGKRYQIIY